MLAVVVCLLLRFAHTRYEVDSNPAIRATQSSTAAFVPAPNFPFRKIYSLFNDRTLYANAQLDDDVSFCDWNLDNTLAWKCMNEKAIALLPKYVGIHALPPRQHCDIQVCMPLLMSSLGAIV